MINFGITGYDQVEGVGINGKMNEFQAAMGLCVLDDIDELLSRRKAVYTKYAESFSEIADLKLQKINPHAAYNYAYFPLVFNSEATREKIYGQMKDNDIFPRRYFSPSLDSLDYLTCDEKMPVSDQISKRILCLPLYESLTTEQQSKIIEILFSGISGD